MNNLFIPNTEQTPGIFMFNNPGPVAKITADGVMHFTVCASDENAKRFIECIDNILAQFGRGKLQSVSAEYRPEGRVAGNRLENDLMLELAAMTPDQRSEMLAPIFERFCKYCGGDRGNRCQCWNDE
jgi:hypothetical protein